jgi:hypothetical protein
VRHYKVNIPVAAQHPASALPSSPLMTTVAVFTRRASSFFASPIRRAIYFGHPAVPRRGGAAISAAAAAAAATETPRYSNIGGVRHSLPPRSSERAI